MKMYGNEAFFCHCLTAVSCYLHLMRDCHYWEQ